MPGQHQVPTQQVPGQQSIDSQIYYNSAYGYQAATTPSQEASDLQLANNFVPNLNQAGYVTSHTNQTGYAANNANQTEYVASNTNQVQYVPSNTSINSQAGYMTPNTNQPGYMDANTSHTGYVQSPQDHHVPYNNSQVPTENQSVNEQKLESNTNVDSQATSDEQTVPEKAAVEVHKTPEVKSELTAFDLLSDIDFSVEQTPLMPEIKVPQISESAIRKPVAPKIEHEKKVPVKEEAIERPAKKDLFSDPSLLNKFTQEVKNLQKLTDSLTDKSPSGLTVLDAKWKNFQDFQTKQNMTRSKTIAMQHTNGNIVTEVVPFDDSRLTLKSDPDAFINASYYKQLAPWCIPLVISKNPTESEYGVFWKAVLENKISCIACLLSEIEMQGKTYWPTAKGQSLELSGLKVTLDEVTCTVHWTERKLTVASGKTVLNVTHYQINVWPAKIVCSPLVLLADKILSQTYDNRLSNQLCGGWLQCGPGAGRSAVLALLIAAMCQVRAGQLELCDMLDAACLNLYTHRSNVLEDTKYLADAYRTALFYVQGVLCSGTTMFNGEAVSLPSGAAVLPPVTPTPTNASTASQKTTKFSRESFEEMKQSPGLKSGDMKDPLNFLDPLWSLKKK